MNAIADSLPAALRHWSVTRDGEGYARLSFDRSGATANTLSAEALAEFNLALDALERDPPQGLTIASGKSSGFIAGADIGEFDAIKTDADALALVQRGWDTFERLAALAYPTLALIRGYCLGGGLELALACRYRVVVDEPATRLGLPEVMLGIVPGWGGMRRLPNLIGAPAAFDLLLTGKTIDARRAKKLGLADECVPARIMDNTARGLLQAKKAPHRVAFPLSLLNNHLLRRLFAVQAAKKVAKRARRQHYPAPYAILDLWTRYDGNALAVPPEDPASVPSLLRSPTAANLIRVFRLQERLKAFGKDSDFKAAHVHVVGAGTMGGDIAAWCALRGLTVTLQDQTAQRLAPAIARANALFAQRLKDARRIRDAADRLIPDVEGNGIARADVIIEAIFEDLAAKRALFTRIEKSARPAALLATNTSSIPLEDIGVALTDPGRLIGLHFFNPVAKMMLVEIVRGSATRAELLPPAAAFVRQIDKLPLAVKSAPGFLVNRLLAPYLLAAMRCVDEGIAPETVDQAARAFGMPMGPLELADSVGLDICVAVGRMIEPGAKPPESLTERVAAGHLGRKTKRGFYAYPQGKAMRRPTRAVPPGLAERLLGPLIAEAKSALAEGIVADADLVDAGAIFGCGFAPYTGGPLRYAFAQAQE